MLKILDIFCSQIPLKHNPKIGDLCTRPYTAHKHGCPNYSKLPDCPPEAPYVTDIIDTTREVYTVAMKFDLGEHVANLKVNHPDWSFRQLHNCLYYQRGARNVLFKYAEDCLEMSGRVMLKKPEANGINVMAMLRKVGIRSKFPVDSYVWFVVIVGYQ
ncbi:hypothetical protein KAW18_02505 [candidate division WOR-3 bacterium]|nr:hypothetical protein [candidate division WOR-3 bacterium]